MSATYLFPSFGLSYKPFLQPEGGAWESAQLGKAMPVAQSCLVFLKRRPNNEDTTSAFATFDIYINPFFYRHPTTSKATKVQLSMQVDFSAPPLGATATTGIMTVNFTGSVTGVDAAGNQTNNFSVTTSGQTLGQGDFLAGSLDTDPRWYCFAMSFDPQVAQVIAYIIEPTTGTLLYKAASPIVAPDLLLPPYVDQAFPDSTQYIRAEVVGNSSVNGHANDWLTNGCMMVGEIAYWEDVVSESEFITLAQKGFAHLNRPTNLSFDWNMMLDWGGGTNIPDLSGNGYDGQMADTLMPSSFSTDNPVPVFIVQETGNEHDVLTLDLFSGIAGECRWGVYPRGHAEPTPADVWNGVAPATSTGSVVLDGASSSQVNIAQPDTGTDYDIYFTQDETGGGVYTEVTKFQYTSPTKYSELITDVTGTSVGAQTGIQWAWFDEENPSQLTTAVTQGTAEITDGTGLLEITLPTTILTPKGSKGTMVLRADWGGGVQTASHLAEVK